MNIKIRYWIPLAVLATCLSFLIYIASQQVIRIGANDQVSQISTDISSRLANKEDVSKILPPQIDLSDSPSPFVIVYDANGKEKISTARIDGKSPLLPDGVLVVAKTNNQNKITWQPKPGVREATVITYFNKADSGFVLAGKSLVNTEILEDLILKLVIAGWLGTLFVTFIAVLIFIETPKKK